VPPAQRLKRALRARQRAMLSFASALVRIPTENPPGARYDECVALIKDELQRCGMVARDVVCRSAAALGARRSVIAEVGNGGPLVYFHGHYDVVPAQERSQFKPIRRGSRLIGRGAADMKCGLAMMVHTVGALADADLLATGRVALVMVPDEETAGELGTAALARGGYLQSGAIGMLTPEPSGGVIWHASRAALTLRVTVRGRAAHVALSRGGANAFTAMTGLAARLSRLEAKVAARRTKYRVRPSSAARSILLVGGESAAGTNFNIVPDRAVFTIDRRLNPEEDFETERARLLELILTKQLPGIEVSVETIQEGRASVTPLDAPLTRALRRSVRAITGRTARVELCPGLLETRHYVGAGIPAVAYGPGDLASAHGPREFVSTARLFECAEIYGLTALSLIAASHTS